MTISHTTAARNAMVDALMLLLDVGGPGSLILLTAADAVIVSLPLNSSPGAFGAAVTGKATANAIGTVNATGSGIIAKFEARNNAGTRVWDGTVGEDTSFDLEMTNTDINVGDPISVGEWTYTGVI